MFSVRGTSPPKPTPEIGEESPQALMRYMLPSSTGVKLVDPLRTCPVAGSIQCDMKSAVPFALPLRYSIV